MCDPDSVATALSASLIEVFYSDVASSPRLYSPVLVRGGFRIIDSFATSFDSWFGVNIAEMFLRAPF